jgi:hypothetical protein
VTEPVPEHKPIPPFGDEQTFNRYNVASFYQEVRVMTTDEAAVLLLQQAALATTSAANSMMAAWIECEGGLLNGTNNPLNVTAPPAPGGGFQLDYWPGSVSIFNDVGVVAFDTAEHGAEACAQNLKNGPQYEGLRAALDTGNVTAFCGDPGLDVWGTGRTCPSARLVTAPAQNNFPLDPAFQQQLQTILSMEDQIERQIALTTASMRAFRTANWPYYDALYCALNGGGGEKLDYTPTFPPS